MDILLDYSNVFNHFKSNQNESQKKANIIATVFEDVVNDQNKIENDSKIVCRHSNTTVVTQLNNPLEENEIIENSINDENAIDNKKDILTQPNNEEQKIDKQITVKESPSFTATRAKDEKDRQNRESRNRVIRDIAGLVFVILASYGIYKVVSLGKLKA